jgi:hypothetical protein
LIQVLVVLWAFVGGVVLVVVAWRGWLRPSRLRQLEERSRANPPAADELDAEWIYGDRAERRSRGTPREIEEEARGRAEAIVRAAEHRAQEILASAERARSQVEAELAREQARMAERSKKLSDFLADALEEVERASANGSASAEDLAELEALRDELRSK